MNSIQAHYLRHLSETDIVNMQCRIPRITNRALKEAMRRVTEEEGMYPLWDTARDASPMRTTTMLADELNDMLSAAKTVQSMELVE